VAGPSATSASNTGFRQLSPPTSVAATDGTLGSGVAISWDVSAGATGYRLFRSLASAGSTGTPAQIAVVGAVGTYLDSTAIPGTAYLYSLRATGAPSGSLSAFSVSDGGFRLLGAPTNVNASDGQFVDRVALSWTASTGAASYQVFRSDSEAPLATAVVGTTYNDTTALPGARFTYTVRAVGSAGPSAVSAPNDGFRQLAAPTGVLASDGTALDRIEVRWNVVLGATAYDVFRSGTSAAIAVVASASFDDVVAAGVPVAGTAYTYTVRARTEVAQSALSTGNSGFRSLPPSAQVSATDGTLPAVVRVSWSPVPGASGYRVRRGLSQSTMTDLSTVGPVSSYDDASAVTGVLYQYSVAATTAAGVSLSALPDEGHRPLAAPVTCNASDGTSAAGVTVTWSTVANAVGYRVLRTEGSETAVEFESVGTGLSFVDTTAAPGVSYNYRVRATGTAPEVVGLLSPVNAGFRQLEAPTTVLASDGTSTEHVAVNWGTTEGAASYQVFRSGTTAALGTVTAPSTSFLDTGATVGTRFTYTVKALGSFTAAVSAASVGDFGHRNRAGPTNVQASEDIPAHVRVTWTLATAGTPAVSGYEIRRVQGEETPVVLTSALAATVTQYDDTTAVPGTPYTYEVRARYTLAGSSPVVVVTTLPGSDSGIRPAAAGSGDGGVAGGGDEGGGADDSALTDGSERVDGSRGGASTAAGGDGQGSGSAEPGAQQPDGDGSDADDDGEDTSVCGAVMRGLEARIAEAGVAVSTADSAEARAQAKDRLESMEALREMMVFTRVDASGQMVQWSEPAACALQRGDMNLDGEVDGADFALFMDAWRAGDEVLADLDRSGVVDAHDLAQMLAAVDGE